MNRKYHRRTGRVICQLLCLFFFVMPAFAAPFSAQTDNSKTLADNAMLNGDYNKVIDIALPLAEAGMPWAQLLISKLYGKALGVSKDLAKSSYWLEKAADNGLPDAMFVLGMKYLSVDTDQHLSSEKAMHNQDMAERLLNAAAEAKPELRHQLFYIGKAAYMKGNYRQAFIMADAAASHGDSDAQFLVGVMFDKGQGVPIYQTEAVNWYIQAANQGHAMAQLYLAIKFDRGDGVTKDMQKAFKWYQKAAEQGMTQAILRVGEMYATGTGVQRNPALSVEWLKKAIEKNSPEAMKALAVKYKNGEGVKQSRYNAADWFYRAGQTFFQQGDKEQALSSIESIELLVPNHFLSKRLLNEIYNPKASDDSQSVNAERGELTYGTAWPVSNQYVVTAYHVLEGRQKITLVDTEDRKIDAKLTVFDHANDLAVLKVDTALQPLRLHDQEVNLGEDVFTIGYPEPDLLGKRAKYTTGKINSLFGFRDDPRFLQISTPIHAGNSGGPLFNAQGEVIGIIISQLNAMRMFETTGDIPQNVNYAIKLPYLQALLSMLPTPIKLSQRAISANNTTMIKQLSGSVLTVIAE